MKLPIGTKVYMFLNHPFRVCEGVVMEHVSHNLFDYVCEFYDPIQGEKIIKSMIAPFLTPEAAETAHATITDLISKHFGKPA